MLLWSNKAHDNINSILISFCMTKNMNQDAIILFDIHEILWHKMRNEATKRDRFFD